MDNNTALVLIGLGVLAAAVALIITGHTEGWFLLVPLVWAIFL